MEEKNKKLDKEMVLKEADSFKANIEELERSANSLNTCDIKDEDDLKEGEAIEKYDLDNKLKKKTKIITNNRHVGHHRWYLKSFVKMKHIILLVIVILFSILCVGKLMPINPINNKQLIATTEAGFGQKIDFSITGKSFKDDILYLTVNIKNKEKNTIFYEPSSFRIQLDDEEYIASIVDNNSSDIYANGLRTGESISINLKYNMKGVTPGGTILLSSFYTDTNSCVIKTAVDIKNV